MTSLLGAPSVSSILVSLVDDVPEPEDVTPGWIYAVVIIGLFVVTILLWLSMRKQLGKIRFDDGSAKKAEEQRPEE
jgi:uncharacterized membrane protein